MHGLKEKNIEGLHVAEDRRFEFLDKFFPSLLFPRETMAEWRGKTSRISLNQR